MELWTVYWNFQKMKYLIVLIVCIASGVTAQKFNRNCSTLVTAKLPTAPAVGMWYLVAREKRPDAFNCYNIKISVKTGTTLTIVASLMADKYVLNNTFNAVPNKNGAWDITTTDGLDNNFMRSLIILFLFYDNRKAISSDSHAHGWHQYMYFQLHAIQCHHRPDGLLQSKEGHW